MRWNDPPPPSPRKQKKTRRGRTPFQLAVSLRHLPKRPLPCLMSRRSHVEPRGRERGERPEERDRERERERRSRREREHRDRAERGRRIEAEHESSLAREGQTFGHIFWLVSVGVCFWYIWAIWVCLLRVKPLCVEPFLGRLKKKHPFE